MLLLCCVNMFFFVVACQRYLCPNVISMTMNVFIFRNLSLKTVFIEPYVKINYSLSLSLLCYGQGDKKFA